MPKRVRSRNHYHEFLDAVLEGAWRACSAGFDYASLVTEAVLLGTMACHPPRGADLQRRGDAVRGQRERHHGFSRRFREEYMKP